MPTVTTPESPIEITRAAAAGRTRDRTFDILKGISIVEVVIHHVLSTSMRKYSASGSWDWWTMAVANRVLHFAVPTFLLASALLLARSIASRPDPDWKRFYRRRGLRTLLPYAMWTIIYLAFRLYVIRTGTDVDLVPTTYPLLGPMAVPQMFEWDRLVPALFAGKAYFHLYFMAVLLQFSLLFPVLYASVRRLPVGFGGIVALGLGLQILAFVLQSTVLRWTNPASTILWYIPPVLTGLWIGMRWCQWGEVWRRAWHAVAAGTAAGFTAYMVQALHVMAGRPASSFVFNLGAIVYASGMALLLLRLSARLCASHRVGALFARIGDWSLPVFLIHPMVLYLLGGPTITKVMMQVPGTPFLLFVLTMGVTWLLSMVLMRGKAALVLFGR